MADYGGYEAFAELPELYDSVPLYADRKDVDFYVRRCRLAAGETLELGCGTGRVLIPAAEAGCVLTGLDQSEQMLARCRTKVTELPPPVRDRITLVCDDMTRFHLGRTFDLIIVPFRPLQHLVSVDDQLGFLRCARDHLNPRGQLIFDVFHVDPGKVAGPPVLDEIEDTPELEIDGGRTIRRTFRILLKRPAEQYSDIEINYYVKDPRGETRRIVQSFRMRYFYRFEIVHLLARSGFSVTALYGDFDESEFMDTSPEMIFVAKPV